MRVAGRTLSLLLVVVLVAGCSLDWLGLEPESTPASPEMASYLAALREMGLERYIGIEPVHERELGNLGWVQYDYDRADCRCIDGGPFHVLARQGAEVEGESTPYTLFWMSGGGACWPGQDACTARATLSQSLTFGLGSRVQTNPVRDWNMISVPYCDGSVHMGNSDADYDDDNVVDHYHHGLKTTSAAVALMKELFPDSTKILIGGCSAGGYGTILAAPVIRLQFPDAQLYVWNENGPGLYNPDRPETLQLILDTWNLEPHLPDDCPHCREQLINIYGWLLARDPALKVGLYSSYGDAVIGGDYLEMTPRAYQGLLLTTTGRLRDEFPNSFKRYLVEGKSHCVEDYGYDVEGLTIHAWIEAMVTDDQAWRDVLE